jgi:hypothetical protein
VDVGLFIRDLLNDAVSISDYRSLNYEVIIEHLIEKSVEEYDCGRLGLDVKMSGTDSVMGGWVYE